MFSSGIYSLADWIRAGIPVVANPKLHKCKRGISDGRAVWVSVEMYNLAVKPRDEESMRDADAIDVVMVHSLKNETGRAF